jgi:branched-chain amino acid transport system substrate-binding protein
MLRATNRQRRRLLALVAAGATALALSGCGGLADDSGSASDGPIKIVATLPLTSPVSAQAKLLQNGYQMAVDEANKSGDLPDGRKLELVVADDKFDPAQAKQLTRQQLGGGGVTAVLGSFGSAVSLTQSEEAATAGVPGVYPFASVPDMVERGYDTVFNTYPLSVDAEKSFDDFLTSEVKPTKVAILYVDNPFAISGAEASKKALEAAGVEVPVFEKYAIDTSDFTQLMAKVKASGADVVKNIGYENNYTGYMQAVAQVKPPVKAVYMETQIPFEPTYQDVVGTDVTGVLGTATWYPGATPDFEKAYKDKYGTDAETQAVFGYSAAEVLIHAIEQAGTDKKALTKALAETDLDTPMGHITFDDRGAYVTEFRVGQLVDGKVDIVWPKDADGVTAFTPTSIS